MHKVNCISIDIKIILYIFFIVLTTLSFGQQDISSLIKKIKPAVVTITTYDENRDTLTMGSGFFINTEGDLVTNYHVLNGAYTAEVRTDGGSVYAIRNIRAANSTADIVLVDIVDMPKPVHYLDISLETPLQGEHILVVGSPFGLELTVSDGIVSAVRDLPNIGKIVQLTAPMSTGSSGGPAVNMAGEVIGIVTFQILEGQNLNFAISGRLILDLETDMKEPLANWTKSLEQKHISEAEKLYYHARYYYIMENYERAIMCFKETASYFEKYVTYRHGDLAVIWIGYNAYLFIGACYRALGQPEQAIWAFKQAILINPSYPEGYEQLACEYDDLQLYAEAIREYKKAIQVDPNYARVYFNLGVLYLELELYEESVWANKKVIELNPNDFGAYNNLGFAYTELFLGKEAAWAYKEAIRINPDSDSLHFNLGVALVLLRNYSEAIESFKQCLRINPDNVRAHHALGMAYVILGDREAALNEYKILKKLDTDRANQLFNLIYE